MAELADAHGSGPCEHCAHEGSSPFSCTENTKQTILIVASYFFMHTGIRRKLSACADGCPVRGQRKIPLLCPIAHICLYDDKRRGMMRTIGIDIGTTTISAVVLDREQERVVTARTVANDGFIRSSNAWERIQDAEMIWRKAKAVLDELLDRYPDTESIGLTGQMHGIVYTNRHGMGISPLYTWQDGSGNLPYQDGMSLAAYISDRYGIRISSGYGLLTHLYHCLHGEVPREGVCLCTIADYMGMRLTDRKKPLVHMSNGAGLGFFDGRKSIFREKMIEELGMDPAFLPEITTKFSRLGEYRGIPVTAALGDNQASFLGSVGRAENTVLLNVGTGGQISVLSDAYFESPEIEARPFADGKYLLAGSSLCGGRAYAILERFFRSYAAAAGAEDTPQYEIMEKLARKGMAADLAISGADDLTSAASPAPERLEVCTAFHGTRADPKCRGSITGMTEDNFTPEGITYGVLKGMAKELYDMYEVIRRGTGICADTLVASGNGVRRNPVLLAIFGQMFGIRPLLSDAEEEAALGAALSSAGDA